MNAYFGYTAHCVEVYLQKFRLYVIWKGSKTQPYIYSLDFDASFYTFFPCMYAYIYLLKSSFNSTNLSFELFYQDC